jgi:hypothetical protein
MRAWREKKVKEKIIKVGDQVLLQSPCTEAPSKFKPKWARPFVTTKKMRTSSFRLADIEGKGLQHSWIADNLYCFYI